MGSIIGNFFGSETNASADETVAISTISGTATSALSYLSAALEATTPEVRRLFSEYSSQSIMANEAIMGLAIKKGWINPYDRPLEQLNQSLSESQSMVSSR